MKNQLQLKIYQLQLIIAKLLLYQRMSPLDRFFLAAQSHLGRDASPHDKAVDSLACAETVNDIHFSVFHEYISP